MSGLVFITYDGGGGDNGGSITYNIQFKSTTSNVGISNTNSVINFKLPRVNIPYSFITFGYTDLNIFVTTQDVNGNWNTVGISNNLCVRI
jgi:hypothetical protein